MKKLFNCAICFLLAGLLFAQDYSPSALKFFDSGLKKQNIEDWYGAGEDFNQAVVLNPSFSKAWFHLAQVTYELNDFNLCLSYLDNALKFAKDETEILILRGMCYISLGRLKDAEEIFNSILKEYPNNIDARFGLAELNLYNGSFDGAEKLYKDALKRQNNNKKALLSLALLSAETGKNETAKKYIEQSLRFHSGDAEVHYLAAYLEAQKGNLTEAERRARSAVQIKGEYTKAYVLLGSILYAQKRYDEVIDICDYLINKDRNTVSAWYLKGLSEYRRQNFADAIDIWDTGLSIDPLDEVMRSCLELLINEKLPLEDDRRSEYSEFHLKKAREYVKLFMGEEARYEYQRALRINPSNAVARAEFADLIGKLGLNELYLHQLKFIQNSLSEQDKKAVLTTKVTDTIEAYESLMKYSLNNKWNTDPFYLDKTRWNLGIYFTKAPVHLTHSDSEEIAAGMAEEIFAGVAITAVNVKKQPVSGYAESYREARRNRQDYFILINFDESEREIALDAVIYNGRNGTEVTKFSLFRTGNDRFASVMRSFRRNVLDILPVRGKILARSGNEILIDLGKTEGIVKGAILDVVKAGNIRTVDQGTGVTFDEKYSLGQIAVELAGEEISQGTLTQNGFYDRVNIGDEVLLKAVPQSESAQGQGAVIADTNPSADENGNKIQRDKKLNAQDLGLIRTPAFIDLIRNIN